MASTIANTPLSFGFLTVLSESNGYMGGYLVTNQWGRPLEFRLSTAVQPNRVQQILYGETLRAYIRADLIGKTLVDKTGAPAQVILTDTEAVLDLRLRLEIPIAWTARPGALPSPEGPGPKSCLCLNRRDQGSVYCHAHFPADGPLIRDLLERLDGVLDLAEPYCRIREAINEARKMGVTARAA